MLASRHAPRAGGGGGGGGYKVVVFHGGKAEEVSVGGGNEKLATGCYCARRGVSQYGCERARSKR